jgi:uncharacterized protein involved in cysteine biosynthesis
MTDETQLIVKVIAGTTLVIALVIGFLERWFTPDYYVSSQSKHLPSWVGWLGWILAAGATIAYVAVDFVQWRGEA